MNDSPLIDYLLERISYWKQYRDARGSIIESGFATDGLYVQWAEARARVEAYEDCLKAAWRTT